MPSKESLIGMFLVHKFWTTFHYDYLDCFIPFVVAPLRDNSTKNLKEIKESIKKDFHFDIPTHPLAAIITRARKRNAVFAENKQYSINPEKSSEYDVTALVAAHQRTLEGVITKLSTHLKTNCKAEFSPEDIETGFLDFLSAHEKEILDGFGNVLVMKDVKKRKELKYHISQFIKYAHEKDNDLYSVIIKISIGQMLSSALFNVHDEQGLEKFRGNLSALRVFFDTRFLLQLLGMEGMAHRDSARELVTSLRALSASCCCCKTTHDEVSRILWHFSDCFKSISERDKATRLRLLRNGIDESKLDMAISDLEGCLREGHIDYHEKVYEEEYKAEYQVDLKALYNTIICTYKRNNASFSEEEGRKRIERDCDVIAEVYQARKMQSPNSFTKANAIFVTTNTGLPQACRIFDDSISQHGKSIVSPSVTDTFIGTIIWVQNPSRVDDIGSKRLIALVNAAMMPETDCIQKYIGLVEQLNREKRISSDAYTLAVAHRVAVNVLEDYTCGCADSLALSTVGDIVRDVELKVKEEETRKTLAEKKLKKRALAEKGVLEGAVKEKDDLINSTADHVQLQAKKVVVPILFFFRASSVLILGVGIAFSIINWNTWYSYTCLSIVGLFTFCNLKQGWTIDGFYRELSASISRKIARFFTHPSHDKVK